MPSNIGAVLGSASWGPVNVPTLVGTPTALLSAFGPIGNANAFGSGVGTTLAATANPYELVSEAVAAFSQASGRGNIALWCVRCVDGTNYAAGGTPGTGGTGQNTTGAYASLALDDAMSVLGITLYGLYMGTLGNELKVSVAVGSRGAGYLTVTITPPGGLGLGQEIYPNIPGTAGTSGSVTSTFWQNFATALTTGMINGVQVRGPSNLVTGILNASLSTAHPATPAIITASAMTGGLDGDTNVTGGFSGTATLPPNMIGSSGATPPTGIYTLGNLNPPVAQFRLAGFGEASGDWAELSTVSAAANSLGAVTYVGFPIGDNSATGTATALVNTTGVFDWEVVPVKDHQFWNDGTSGPRFFPTAPFVMGYDLTLPPERSPLNGAILGTIGSYRDVSAGSPAPYSNAEIGQCQSGGITLIAKPSPGGNYEGFNTAVNASASINLVTAPLEYATMTNFMAKSLAGLMGKYVGMLQSPIDPQDPTRAAVAAELNNFGGTLVNARRLAAFAAVCDLSNNTATTIALHYLFAAVQAAYFASIWFFLLSFTGGTTVQVQVQQGPAAG